MGPHRIGGGEGLDGAGSTISEAMGSGPVCKKKTGVKGFNYRRCVKS